jgi:hypothetical protein
VPSLKLGHKEKEESDGGRHNRLLERNSKRRKVTMKVAQAEPGSNQLNSDAVEPSSIQF